MKLFFILSTEKIVCKKRMIAASLRIKLLFPLFKKLNVYGFVYWTTEDEVTVFLE